MKWKIRQAEKGRITVGAVQRRHGDGPAPDFKVLPLRMQADLVTHLDEARERLGLGSWMDLDEYRTYFNEHRANQAIDGNTPAGFGRDSPGAEVISLDEVRQKRLVQRSFAHGILNSYELVDAPPEEQADAAA